MIQYLEKSIEDTVGIEDPTEAELTAKGVPTDQWPYLIGFNKKMLMLYRTFTGETLQLEKQSLINQYVLRGYPLNVLGQLQGVVDDYVAPVCPTGYTRVLHDYFATGDFSKWDQADDVHLVTDPVYKGVYAVESTAVAPQVGYLYKALTATPKIHTTRYLRFGDLTGAGSQILEELSNNRVNYHGALYIYCDGAPAGQWRLVLWDYVEAIIWHEGTIILSADTWYKVDIEWEQGLAGRKRLWIDDMLDVDFVADGLAMDISAFEAWIPRADQRDQTGDDYRICRV